MKPMNLFMLQSPLTDFANLIAGYFAEIWEFRSVINRVAILRKPPEWVTEEKVLPKAGEITRRAMP